MRVLMWTNVKSRFDSPEMGITARFDCTEIGRVRLGGIQKRRAEGKWVRRECSSGAEGFGSACSSLSGSRGKRHSGKHGRSKSAAR